MEFECTYWNVFHEIHVHFLIIVKINNLLEKITLSHNENINFNIKVSLSYVAYFLIKYS